MAIPKSNKCIFCGGHMLLFIEDHGNFYEECPECSYSTELKTMAEFRILPYQLQKELALLVEPESMQDE